MLIPSCLYNFFLTLPVIILQETLRRRQQAFRKTEEEIEARLAEEEEKEEQRHEEQYNSNKQQENHTGNTSCRESGMFRQRNCMCRCAIKYNFLTSHFS